MEERTQIAEEERNEETAEQAAISDRKVPAGRRKKVAIAIGAVALALVCFFGGWFARYYSLDAGLRRFIWAKSMIDSHYYQDLDDDALYDEIMGVLESRLDPYSCYFTAEEYDKLLAEKDGKKTGVGIVLTEEDGVARLYSVVGNSPAEEAGLKKGMYVTAWYGADGAELRGSGSELESFIGAQEAEFALACGFRKDGGDARKFTLTKRTYLATYCAYADGEGAFAFRGAERAALASVDGADVFRSLNAKTAYIRIAEFNGSAADEFAALLSLMKERGRSDLILDLRGNGGGYLDVLGSIASHLLRNAEGSKPDVLTSKEKDGSRTVYRASSNEYSAFFGADSVVTVLADSLTASASECLIGALLDYGTVGYENIWLRRETDDSPARTYGKGIMQSNFSGSGGTMKLTVATVHWPLSDRCIQGVGISESDGAHALTADYYDETDAFLSAVIGQIG
ncbi:MAG: S41 family peptidase [Candidatus Gallimonas sp.]